MALGSVPRLDQTKVVLGTKQHTMTNTVPVLETQIVEDSYGVAVEIYAAWVMINLAFFLEDDGLRER